MTKRWTDADSQRLHALAAEGLTDDQMAAAMGRHPNTIRHRRRRLGLPRSDRWTPAEDAQLCHLVDQLFSDRHIATTMGISIDGIRKRRRALGLQAAGKPGCSFRHGKRALKRISRASRKRWKKAAFRAAVLPSLLAAAEQVRERREFRRPPKKTPARTLYDKLRRVVGYQAARAELARNSESAQIESLS